MRISIVPQNLHWLPKVPAERDLCAHGGVVVTCDGEVLIDDRDKQWALSAAALYLLRTLTSDHTQENALGEQLFPCCGHAMYAEPESQNILIVGCPNGRDWAVLHREESVVLMLEGGRQLKVSRSDWRDAVLAFSDAVEGFYAGSADKQPADEEAAGFTAFRAEWKRRREAA